MDGAVTNKTDITESRPKLEYFKTSFKKDASLVTQTVDDNIVTSLDVLDRDPRAIWDQLARVYGTLTPAQHMAARKACVDSTISEESTHLEIKQSFSRLLRKVTLLGVAISVDTFL